MQIFLNTTDMKNPTIEITNTRQDLYNQLSDEWSSPFEQIEGDVFYIILDDRYNGEPTTARGMMKALNIYDEWKHLLTSKFVDFVVDDRALIVNLK